MKKSVVALTLISSVLVVSPVWAASWQSAVNADVAKGDYAAINQVVANNPAAGGEIGAYLMNLASKDSSDPSKAVQLFDAAVPLASQISENDAGTVIDDIKNLLKLANDPAFQKSNPNGAASIFADALNALSLPNIGSKDPQLHGTVLAEAGDFVEGNPDLNTNKLKEDVSLAQGADLNGTNPDLNVIRLRQRTGDTPPSPPASPLVTSPSPQ